MRMGLHGRHLFHLGRLVMILVCDIDAGLIAFLVILFRKLMPDSNYFLRPTLFSTRVRFIINITKAQFENDKYQNLRLAIERSSRLSVLLFWLRGEQSRTSTHPKINSETRLVVNHDQNCRGAPSSTTHSRQSCLFFP